MKSARLLHPDHSMIMGVRDDCVIREMGGSDRLGGFTDAEIASTQAIHCDETRLEVPLVHAPAILAF